jgi:hypothetical protein
MRATRSNRTMSKFSATGCKLDDTPLFMACPGSQMFVTFARHDSSTDGVMFSHPVVLAKYTCVLFGPGNFFLA